MVVGRAAAELVAERLAAAGCVAPEEEAKVLVAFAPDAATLEAWTGRREQGEPLAWITGAVQFCGDTVRVDDGVYVPRDQTEELARRAAALLPRDGTAADLCTGSGAIAVHLASRAPMATVVAVDIDRRAAACARRNGVPVVVGDLAGALRPGVFDVVTAVAPYVPTAGLALLPVDVRRHEPPLALDGGADGLEVVRRIVDAAVYLLRKGGWLLVEVGGDQDAALRPALDANGFDAVTTWFDEDGDLRGVAARANALRRP